MAFTVLSLFGNYLRPENGPVTLKQESKSIFDLSRRLADEFAGSRRLRMPVDFSPKDHIVVYPCSTGTLLDLYLGEAIQEFHAKVCIYALGGGRFLLSEDKEMLAELAKLGITPREDILPQHFTYFGLVNEELLKEVDDYEHSTLKKVSATAELAVKNQPELQFKVWGKELGEAALDMISGMTKPDPKARLTID
ncbi:hypothetical protein GQX73_g5468 [Xylaria multiplex]|uniref:Uncharacterized protein n=1 Tax=Xylaria multiplex TaxID=323545 RepID=A0A7C8IPC9_9PEZI|nr:hypothetical protein GQX73_g5468 [Xylaria multiplex]